MLVKDIKLFSKKKKKKTDNMVVKDTKIPSKDEKQKMVEYSKKTENEKKWLLLIIRNYFHLEKLILFLSEVGEMRR